MLKQLGLWPTGWTNLLEEPDELSVTGRAMVLLLLPDTALYRDALFPTSNALLVFGAGTYLLAHSVWKQNLFVSKLPIF